MSFLKNDCDVMLKSVFMFKTAAVNMVHGSFELYASSGDWCLILLHVFTFWASVVYSCSLSFLYHSWWIYGFNTTRTKERAEFGFRHGGQVRMAANCKFSGCMAMPVSEIACFRNETVCWKKTTFIWFDLEVSCSDTTENLSKTKCSLKVCPNIIISSK